MIWINIARGLFIQSATPYLISLKQENECKSFKKVLLPNQFLLLKSYCNKYNLKKEKTIQLTAFQSKTQSKIFLKKKKKELLQAISSLYADVT